MNKRYNFIAGMPRSGSTLLCNILCQNPSFRATGTSPLPQFLLSLNNIWNNSAEAKANYNTEDKLHLLKTVMENYHIPFSEEVIFEKSRAWPVNFEFLESLLGKKPKIIVCTRNMAEIMSSCEKIWRKEIANLDNNSSILPNMMTQEGRLSHWGSADQLIGSSYNALQDCVARGHKNSLHRVDFFDLTTNPKQTLKKIHDFVEEPWFDYDFDNIEQKIHEKDEFHGFSKEALHTIRQKVEYPTPDYYQILGKHANQLMNFNYNFLD